MDELLLLAGNDQKEEPLWNRSWLFCQLWRLAHPSLQDVVRL